MAAISFSAQWTPALQGVRPSTPSLIRRVYECIKAILFYIPNYFIQRFINRTVLPVSALPLSKIQRIDQVFRRTMSTSSYNVSELKITTPDHIQLQGHFIKHKDHDTNPHSRILLLFHGNGTIYQEMGHLWLSRLLQQANVPYSFVLCNLRGTGMSQQKPISETAHLIDADSIYQSIKDNLRVPEERIDIYGHSLGGALAANLKKLHPHTQGRLFLDRTFSSLGKEISYVLGNTPILFQKAAAYITQRYGWEYNVHDKLTSIQDKVHVFTHIQDGSIPLHCSLGGLIQQTNPHPQTITVHHFSGGQDPHCDPLMYTSPLSTTHTPLPTSSTQILLDAFHYQTPTLQAGA